MQIFKTAMSVPNVFLGSFGKIDLLESSNIFVLDKDNGVHSVLKFYRQVQVYTDAWAFGFIDQYVIAH